MQATPTIRRRPLHVACMYVFSAMINIRILKLDFVDRCTGMIIENYLSTTSTFPITYGTAISVECDSEHVIQGSKVIICQRGILYSHQSFRPRCVNPGKHTCYRLFILLFVLEKNYLMSYFKPVSNSVTTLLFNLLQYTICILHML